MKMNQDEQESRKFPYNLMFKTVFTFCFLQLSYHTKYVNKFSFNFCLHWSGGIKRAGGGRGVGGEGGRESPVAGEVRGDKVKKTQTTRAAKSISVFIDFTWVLAEFKGQFFDHGLSIG